MFDVWLVFLFGFAGYVFRKLDYPLEPLVLAHGGGALPFLIGRLNLGYYAPKYEFNTDCQKNISPPPLGSSSNSFISTHWSPAANPSGSWLSSSARTG